ncbi:LuxR family transcriptional regulator, partial [Streptomyces carpinensis]
MVVPLPERLEEMFAERLSAVPEATRRMLLLAAAADDPDTRAVVPAASAAVPGADVEVWAAAESAGLVRLDHGRVEFRHPLMRSAVYGAASFPQRREAHLLLAQELERAPDRRAWHMAAAALGPDESIARALAETAGQAGRRGGHRAGAAALEKAARLSEREGARARRLLDASDLAMRAGEPWWATSLAADATEATDDDRMLAEAALRRGQAAAVTGRHRAALSHLLPLAASGSGSAGGLPEPAMAAQALAHLAGVVHDSGDDLVRRRVLELFTALPGEAGDIHQEVWTRACCDPHGDRRKTLGLLDRAVSGPGLAPDALMLLGRAAWVLDETALAVRLLGEAAERLRAVTPDTDATLSHALAWAQFDAGAWESAWVSAEDARRAAADNGMRTVASGAGVVGAMVLASRGDVG